MKLLFTSDLHAPADEGPYRRLGIFAQENRCALVAIAGDLLDLFSKGYPGSQTHSAAGWLRALAAGVPHLAVCSGNHDPDGPDGAGWLARAAIGAPAGNLFVDGASAVLPDGGGTVALIVTCCPYWNIQERGVTHLSRLRKRAQGTWEDGRRLADLHPGLSWVALHHEPPEGSRVATGGYGIGSATCAEWCRTYRPDFLLCGHIHHGPFVEGGAWADRVPSSPTWAFNPGRGNASGSRLIEVDTARCIGRWLLGDGEEVDRRRLTSATDEPGAEEASRQHQMPSAELAEDDPHSV